ncbi:MAG: tetratricopeptide repeat protein [Planctomycetota bacterium]
MRAFLLFFVLASALSCGNDEVAFERGGAQVLCRKGFDSIRDDKPDDALASFRQALLMRPKYAGAQYGIGSALEEMGELEQALEAYDLAIEYDPEFALALWVRGLLLNEVGDEGEGDDDIEAAYELDPRLRPIEAGTLVVSNPSRRYEPWLH